MAGVLSKPDLVKLILNPPPPLPPSSLPLPRPRHAPSASSLARTLRYLSPLLWLRLASAVARAALRSLVLSLGWFSAPSLRLPWPRALRFLPPLRLRRLHLALLAHFLGRGLATGLRGWLDRHSGVAAARRALEARKLGAGCYEDWCAAAVALESLRLGGEWGPPVVRRGEVGWGGGLGVFGVGRALGTALGVFPSPPDSLYLDESLSYDRALLESRTAYLKRLRQRNHVSSLAFVLRSDLVRSLAGINNSELSPRFRSVPATIRAYVAEVRRCLRAVASSDCLPVEERLAFLRETRHAFGRSALVLSGGGSFGTFHMGVAKALLDVKMLPRVLAGSSAGAISAAVIATRTEAELERLYASMADAGPVPIYSSQTTGQLVGHLWHKGTLQDTRVLQARLRRLLGDLTFAEAYARSGRVLCVSVTAADTREPPRLLNYLTAPHVLVWSAVACSSAFPVLYAPQALLARDARGRVVEFTMGGASDLLGSKLALSGLDTPSLGERVWGDADVEGDDRCDADGGEDDLCCASADLAADPRFDLEARPPGRALDTAPAGPPEDGKAAAEEMAAAQAAAVGAGPLPAAPVPPLATAAWEEAAAGSADAAPAAAAPRGGAAPPPPARKAPLQRRRWRDGSLELDLPLRGLSEMFNVNYTVVSQCNPHLLPFISLKALLPGWLGALLETEFKHRCAQGSVLLPASLSRGLLGRLFKLFDQPWGGDCTMTMPWSFSMLKAITNFDKDDLVVAVQQAQQATWAKLSAIECNLAVETTLDDCLALLASQQRVLDRVGGARRAMSAVAGVPLHVLSAGESSAALGHALSLHLQGPSRSLGHAHSLAHVHPSLLPDGGSPGGGGGGSRLRLRRGLPSWVHMPGLAGGEALPSPVEGGAAALPPPRGAQAAAGPATGRSPAFASAFDVKAGQGEALSGHFPHSLSSMPEAAESEEEGPLERMLELQDELAFAPRPDSPHLGCDVDTWRDLFNATQDTSSALDIIAP